MPLIKSKSKKAIAHNIKAEIAAGKPQKQAIAIAFNVKPKHAQGGPVMSDDKMMSALMMRRRKKLSHGGMSDYDEPEAHMEAPEERPHNAKMNNVSPDLARQSRVDMGDNEDNHFDHKLSDESSAEERESALYADGGDVDSDSLNLDPDKLKSAQDSMRKAFKFSKGGVAYNSGVMEEESDDLPQEHNEDDTEHSNIPRPKSGYAKGGKVTSGPHASRKIAYGHGLSESEQQDESRLRDEDSEIAMAEGGIAYNPNLKENYQSDTEELSDEDSHIAMAEGGVLHAKHLDPDMKDTPESHDEDSHIAMAEGGDVSHAKHLDPDMEDTHESKDEASSIAMAGGGQIDDDQSPGHNPKSFQDEDEQEHMMRARRRKLMIQALNE